MPARWRLWHSGRPHRGGGRDSPSCFSFPGARWIGGWNRSFRVLRSEAVSPPPAASAACIPPGGNRSGCAVKPTTHDPNTLKP
eukprot:8560332-Pyramimonas_sp.AAC.1